MSQPSEVEAQVIVSEERNPYAPSVGVLNASRDPADFVDPHLKLAPRSRRFANSLLDTLCFFLVMFLLGLVNAVVHLKFGVDPLASAGPVFGLGVSTCYYFLTEVLTGKTPGKYLTRTRVVDETGGRAKPVQILLRSLYRLVPFDAFSFLSEGRPGWHDRWSKTRVIMDRRD
jgi:uncharacterized RDD family membrane protein YckC